jgi:ABC-type sulfate/molybdate transport systems ATPase subunit
VTIFACEPVHKREIGMVFQHYALFLHMNVFDNVAFGLSVRHKDTGEIARRVQEILQLVELGGFEKNACLANSPPVSSSAWRCPVMARR